MTKVQWETCKNYCYSLFEFGQKLSLENGLILVDTKYEFGVDENGTILLVDEIHTPDSSRYWLHHNYKERFLNNKEPEYIDKEIVRRWVKENTHNPYNLNEEIVIPDDVRLKLSSKYLQLHELITGNLIS